MRLPAYGIVLVAVAAFAHPTLGKDYDYCDSGTDENAPSTQPQLWVVDSPSISRGTNDYTANIVHTDLTGTVVSRWPRDVQYRIVLIPTGYEQRAISQEMEQLIDILQMAYCDIPVGFAYVAKNMPVALSVQGQYVFPMPSTQGAALLAALQPVCHPDAIALIIRTDHHMGTADRIGGRVAIADGKNRKAFHVIIHEVAHLLGLQDGYRTYFEANDLNGSELFMSIGDLVPYVRRAYEKVRPAIVPTKGRCAQREVYAFAPHHTIMSEDPVPNGKLLRNLRKGQPLFTAFQKEVMRQFIAEKDQH